MSILVEYAPREAARPNPSMTAMSGASVRHAVPVGPATRGSIVALDAVDAFAAFLNRRILAESARIAQAAQSLTSI